MNEYTPERSNTKKLVTTALCAAVICVLGPVSVPLPISPVPVSLALFAIFIAVYALDMRLGAAAVSIYILLGLAGLPVFSGFSGGFGKLAGPTGGYIIGYLFTALISGLFIDRFENKRAMHIIGMAIGTTVCYAFGTAWLAWQGGMSFSAALLAGVIPFIPADCAKIIAAAIIGPKLRRAARNVSS